jgi:hypothetical protein
MLQIAGLVVEAGPKSASRRSPQSPFLDNFRVADHWPRIDFSVVR